MKLRRSRTEINLLKEQVEVLSNVTAGGSEEIIIGDSPVMQQVFSTVEKLRDTDANILILGENGTGKDVIARLLYRNSPRYGKPFVTIDLGSIPEQLFESELFGYEKGAFTDARKAKAGRMEVATGGTLFLDEIGNLSLPMQAKLLTAIESVVSVVWEVRRLRPLMCGSSAPPMQTSVGWWTKETSAKTCCIASTPSNSISPSAGTRKRHPLAGRVFSATVCPQISERDARADPRGEEQVAEICRPGNVRELQHTMERAVILGDGSLLRPENFMFQASASRQKKEEEVLNLEQLERRRWNVPCAQRGKCDPCRRILGHYPLRLVPET